MFTVKSNQRASKRIKRRARQLAARLARFSNSNQRGYPKQLETAAERISQCPVKIDYLNKKGMTEFANVGNHTADIMRYLEGDEEQTMMWRPSTVRCTDGSPYFKLQ